MVRSRRRESWRVFDRVESTNDTIHEAGGGGAPEGTAHLAGAQTRGRGRAGRSWWSPAGAGLWFSVLLRPALDPARTPGIALVAGRAARDALDPLTDTPVEIHWPNDIIAHGRKLGGILCEARSRGPENSWIALGIGINIDHGGHQVPDDLRGAAATLVEIGCTERRPIVLAKVITDRFWPLYDRYQGGEPLSALVGAALAHVGSRVTVRLSATESFSGRVAGLGERGELLVDEDGGARREVLAGDVHYHEPT